MSLTERIQFISDLVDGFPDNGSKVLLSRYLKELNELRPVSSSGSGGDITLDTDGLATAEKQAELIASTDVVTSQLNTTLSVRNKIGTLAQGSVEVAVAGTAVSMPSKVLSNSVMIQWHPDNTGRVYYGDSSVENSLSSPYLDASIPAASVELENLNELYVNADNSGDRVLWVAH